MATEHRERLIDAGVALIHRRGFGATGVREIAGAAGVPQGSFTNHFRSKEEFGTLVLDRYFAQTDAIMRDTLENHALEPAARIRAYFDRAIALMAEEDWRHGCLIPDLAAEAPMHSETLRLKLQAVLDEQAKRFGEAFDLARANTPEPPDDLGAFVMAAWHGTLLRMKTDRNPAALDRFRRGLDGLLHA